MKKTYVKPQIAYESFQLSTSIATDCALLSTRAAQYICPVEDKESGFYIFAEANQLCDTVPVGGDDSVCYDVPTESWKVFSS